MKRYDGIQNKILSDGKKVLKTKIFNEIPKSDTDIYVITQETDRLDLLANQFYNDSSLWWVISLANNLNSADIGLIPGTQLRIPSDISSVLNLLKK